MPFKRFLRSDIALRRVLQDCEEETCQILNVRETDALLVNNVPGLRNNRRHASCLRWLTQARIFLTLTESTESELSRAELLPIRLRPGLVTSHEPET